MAYYAIISESTELIPLSDLVFPIRIYFIVSDSNEGESVSFPIRYYDISNEIKSETLNLPFVYEMSGKYFYSFMPNSVAGLDADEPTPTPEQPTPTPEQPTPTPLQPTPTPEQPTPTPLQPTPTPEDGTVDNSDNESECISGYTINNNEIYRGIQLKYSSGQIIVDAKEYTPSPSIPTLIYIYLGSTETENFCGRINVNSRVDGISNSTFNNTIISYVHSDGKCYNKDINGIIGNDNYIVFGEEDEETTNAIQSCCSNLQVISSKSSNNYGIRLSDSDGMICVDPKNYTHSFGLPVVVYIYINNYTQYGETYRGKITFQNRLNGLGEDSFNSDNLIYIDSDDKCYNIKLSEVNELNNIKIFNTYN